MNLEEAPYKVVEISDVNDVEIEKALNEWRKKGYIFESIHFVTREGSRRPSMAFIFFTRKDRYLEGDDEDQV